MGQILQPIFILLRSHKLKLLSFLLFTLFFFVALFPNSDLGDLVSAQVVRTTGFYIEFDALNLDLLPAPGIGAENISIEPRGMPPLKAETLDASLSLAKLLGLRLGVNASLTNLFKGNVDVTYGQGAKAQSGARMEEVGFRAENLSLDDLSSYLGGAGLLPVKLQGKLKTDISAQIDPQFAEQPAGTVSLEIPQFVLPSQMITVDFNGVPVQQQLPGLNLGRVTVKNLRLHDGVLEIQDTSVGDAKSDVNGKIKGTIALSFRRDPAGVRPELTSADIAMDLNVDKGFMERNQKTVIGGFLILIPPNAKQESPKGTRLAFRMKINRPGEMPSFTPLNEKL